MAAEQLASRDGVHRGLEPDDTLLLLLSAVAQQDQSGAVPRVTRLMKLLFLAGEEAGITGPENFTFVPYKYGPFGQELYPTLAHMRQLGLLDVQEMPVRDYYQELELRDLGAKEVLRAVQNLGYGRSGREPRQIAVRLTLLGQEAAQRLRAFLPRERWQRLVRLVDQYAHLPLNELLAYVYQRYPHMAVNSVLPMAHS